MLNRGWGNIYRSEGDSCWIKIVGFLPSPLLQGNINTKTPSEKNGSGSWSVEIPFNPSESATAAYRSSSSSATCAYQPGF